MGQQQLLLIIVAIIVIGVSVTIANQLFYANAEDSNKDSIISELTNLATISLQYYQKPASIVGGGKSFTNWQIPSKLDTSTSGTYTISQASNKHLILNGNPIQGSGYSWWVKATITKSKVVTEKINQSSKIVKWITTMSEGWIEMFYLLIGIIIFGIVVFLVTYVRSIRKSRREIDVLFKKKIN